MIPEEACTGTTIVSIELQLSSERAMKDVCSSGLHASNVNRIEAFMVNCRIAILLHDEFTILDSDVLSIVFHVESNVGIVRVLLEVVDHPVVHQRFCFAFGFMEQIVNIWRFGEILNDTMGVDTTSFFVFPATWTVV